MMRVYNLDYGANLFEIGGKIYLFDCGTKAIGRNSVVPFIKQMYPQQTRIEAIFISHWHNNHTGGIPLIMREFEVGHIYSNGTYSDDPKPAYAIDPIVEAEIKTLIDELNVRSEEHTSELQSRGHLVCRLLLVKKKRRKTNK